jgi:signal transduction histidine kinase
MDGRAMRVLLVEDDPGDVRLLAELLREAGGGLGLSHEPTLAAALPALSSGGFDAALLDLSLPDAAGAEALARAVAAAPATAVIALSANADERLALDAIRRGAQDCLAKGQLDAARLARALGHAVERKRAEEASAQLLRERAARADAEAQAAARARDEILAVISHDLRNPLNVVSMTAGLLDRDEPLEPERRRRHVARIQRAVERMNALVRDLIDVAKIEAGRFVISRERHEVAPIVADAAELLKPLAAEKALSLELALAPDLSTALLDRERVRQVLSNLVGNAIKFTPAGGRLWVRAERAGDELRFAVRDTGPGIAAEHLARVFDRFSQAGRKAREGAGLGLAIARGIVEAHGGRIWAESPGPGRGSTFVLTLPPA